MRWKTREPTRPRSLCQSVEIGADTAEVFAHWTRFEHFPEFMQSVRRAKRISDRRVLWDVVIAGRQLVWEAHVLAFVPDTCIRWESRRKPRMVGEVTFEQLGPRRTRVTVEIDYQPDGLLERIGARLGWVDDCVRRELAAFRDHVQWHPRVRPIGLHAVRDRDGRQPDIRRSAPQPIHEERPTSERLRQWSEGSTTSSRPDDEPKTGNEFSR